MKHNLLIIKKFFYRFSHGNYHTKNKLIFRPAVKEELNNLYSCIILLLEKCNMDTYHYKEVLSLIIKTPSFCSLGNIYDEDINF